MSTTRVSTSILTGTALSSGVSRVTFWILDRLAVNDSGNARHSPVIDPCFGVRVALVGNVEKRLQRGDRSHIDPAGVI